MNLLCLPRRTNHAVQPRLLCIFSVMQNDLLHFFPNKKLFLQGSLVCGSQLRHRNEKRTLSLSFSGKAFHPLSHHFYSAGSVQVRHIYPEVPKRMHAAFYRIRNVMQFQIQKNRMSSFLDFSNDFRSFAIEEFHPDLHIRLSLLLLKQVQKAKRLFSTRKIECHHNILSHLLSCPF